MPVNATAGQLGLNLGLGRQKAVERRARELVEQFGLPRDVALEKAREELSRLAPEAVRSLPVAGGREDTSQAIRSRQKEASLWGSVPRQTGTADAGHERLLSLLREDRQGDRELPVEASRLLQLQPQPPLEAEARRGSTQDTAYEMPSTNVVSDRPVSSLDGQDGEVARAQGQPQRLTHEQRAAWMQEANRIRGLGYRTSRNDRRAQRGGAGAVEQQRTQEEALDEAARRMGINRVPYPHYKKSSVQRPSEYMAGMSPEEVGEPPGSALSPEVEEEIEGAGGVSEEEATLARDLEIMELQARAGGAGKVGGGPGSAGRFRGGAPAAEALSYEDSSLDGQDGEAAAKVAAVPPGAPGDQATERIAVPKRQEVGGRPDTVARILEVLGGIGAGIGKSRSIGKANKLTAQRQALSNLVNTLRGSATAGVAPETPRAGLLQTLGEGLGAGAKSFRAGRKEGRDERNLAARKEFEDKVALEQLENQGVTADAARLRALAAGDADLTAGENKDQWEATGALAAEEGKSIEEALAIARQSPDYDPAQARLIEGYITTGYRGEGRTEEASQRAGRTEDRAIEVHGYRRDEELRAIARETRAGLTFERTALEAEDSKEERLRQNERANAYLRIAEAKEDREVAGVPMAAEALQFNRRELIRKEVMGLPGVRAFSGNQGIGPAYARMKETYLSWKNNPGETTRSALQLALVNNFQRLIDPATVREGDIALMKQADAFWDRFTNAVPNWAKGGFISDELLEGFMREAVTMQSAHRRFVQQSVSGAINVWDKFHPASAMSPDDTEGIANSILGGEEASLFDLMSDAQIAQAALDGLQGAEGEARKRGIIGK